MDVKRAAKRVRLSKSTLDKWRAKGVGPRWVVLGTHRIAYRVSDLEDWLRSQTRGGQDPIAIKAA